MVEPPTKGVLEESNDTIRVSKTMCVVVIAFVVTRWSPNVTAVDGKAVTRVQIDLGENTCPVDRGRSKFEKDWFLSQREDQCGTEKP